VKDLSRFNNFDLIRLIAAAQVMYNHSIIWLHIPQLSAIEGLVDMFPGVPIFFVVSGFLVTRSFVQNDGRLGRYAVNRALRIYPGLWANILVILVLLTATGSMTAAMVSPAFFEYQLGQFVFGSEVYGYLLSNFGYDHSPGHFFSHGYPSGVCWTINVELGFYVLVPVLFSRAVRERRCLLNTVIVLAAVGSIGASAFTAHALKATPNALSNYFLAYGPLPYLWVFLLGAGAYLNWDRLAFVFEDRFASWLSAYLVFAMIDVYGIGSPTVDLARATPLVALKAVLLAGTVLSFAHSCRRLAAPLRGVDLSYGLYLYHMPIIFVMIGLGLHDSVWLWPLIYLCAAVAAALSWFLIERPALAFKRTLGTWTVRSDMVTLRAERSSILSDIGLHFNARLRRFRNGSASEDETT
jgi:peptidoglycan/LPS O-acetylase OafA/YrhL